jgi:H+/Cl- antiporter ClcA
LGACVAQGVGDRLSSTVTERKILIASGASAGLAAGFNAPLAGALFALEEIFKYFSPVILLSTILSAIVADFVSRIILGVGTVFQFELVGTSLKDYWLLDVLGFS